MRRKRGRKEPRLRTGHPGCRRRRHRRRHYRLLQRRRMRSSLTTLRKQGESQQARSQQQRGWWWMHASKARRQDWMKQTEPTVTKRREKRAVGSRTLNRKARLGVVLVTHGRRAGPTAFKIHRQTGRPTGEVKFLLGSSAVAPFLPWHGLGIMCKCEKLLFEPKQTSRKVIIFGCLTPQTVYRHPPVPHPVLLIRAIHPGMDTETDRHAQAEAEWRALSMSEKKRPPGKGINDSLKHCLKAKQTPTTPICPRGQPRMGGNL